MSIFSLITTHILSRFKCYREYYTRSLREPSTTEHVSSGVVYSLLCILSGCFYVYLLPSMVIVWLYYALFKELVLDRKKNRGRPSGEVKAQILERSVGFVITLPLALGVLLWKIY